MKITGTETMGKSNLPEFEDERIAALKELEILDTPPDEKFDRITKIAQILFDVPIALVSLVDVNRQWFKSCVGLSVRETPRSMSFCSHAILEEDVMAIEDAKNDKRFADNPLVTGDPFIRFYAGKPIRGPTNQLLGTLCIIDKVPRKLSRGDRAILIDLANWVESEIKTMALNNELKKITLQLKQTEQELIDKNLQLEMSLSEKTQKLVKSQQLTAIGTMASRLAHDIKNPLSVIQMTSDLLSEKLEKNMDDTMKDQCQMLKNSITDITRIVEDVLDFVTSKEIQKSESSLLFLLNNSLSNIVVPSGIKIDLPKNDITINCDGKKIGAVFSNLIINSIQAMGSSGHIFIRFRTLPEKITIEFEDSGKGISDENIEKVFEPLFTTKSKGTGLGLGICKAIIEQHSGTLSVSNNPTIFTIELPKD